MACPKTALQVDLRSGSYVNGLPDIATSLLIKCIGGERARLHTCSEELNRPENASVKDIVGKLKKAKAAIDAGGM